jgi:hypothetical protein
VTSWCTNCSKLNGRVHFCRQHRSLLEAVAEVADALERAPRHGADRDEPEGARVVTLSDTLARQLAARCRGR